MKEAVPEQRSRAGPLRWGEESIVRCSSRAKAVADRNMVQRDATTSEWACLAMHSVRLEHQSPAHPAHPEQHLALLALLVCKYREDLLALPEHPEHPAQVSDVVASGGGGIAVAY